MSELERTYRSTHMSHIFISGSSTGLGLMAAKLYSTRTSGTLPCPQCRTRRRCTPRATPSRSCSRRRSRHRHGSQGSRGTRQRTRPLVIHNTAVGYREPPPHQGRSPACLAINTLSAYITTALIELRAACLSQAPGCTTNADANLDDILWKKRRWDGFGSLRWLKAPRCDACLRRC